MMRRVHPAYPGVPDEEMACPGCGQTFEIIRDGGQLLPRFHYREPFRSSNARAPRVAISSWPSNGPLCSYVGDDLVYLVAVAQLDRARGMAA